MAMFTYQGRTLLSIQLTRLRLAIASDIHTSVLDEISNAIAKCGGRVDRIHPDDDGALDFECELIESLLGTAYVVCQGKITAVVERARPLLKNKPPHIRSMGPRFDAHFSKIEILWALGNYFKHQDEWKSSEWDVPTDQRIFTIPALKAAGLQASSTGNLRVGATALGNCTYEDTTVFQKIIDEWSAVVIDAARSEAAGR